MLSHVARMVPKQLRPYIEPAYQRIRRWSTRLDRAFDKRTMPETRFAELLGELGVASGATVMVHSSMNEIERRVPTLNPLMLIRLLQQLLGEEGTLLVPTFPFSERQLHYVETHDTFDVRKTPSQVGLMTEVFRRLPGVIRSLHPTHSIAGWGKHAEEILSTHHLGSAFGENSPIFKLQRYGGLVVSLGAPFKDSFTILHVPEELHPKTREFAYEKNTRFMTIINGSERTRYEFHVLRGDVDRNFGRVEKALLKDGIVKCVNEKGLKCLVTRADRFIERSMELIEAGKYLF